MSRAIRHGWYEDMNQQHHVMIMARAFVQEGGRTPYFLFPRWSARPDGEQRWVLYTSWPPLPYYALTPIVLLSRDPHVQIFWARFMATLVMATGSWLVFVFFRRILQDDGLALVAQAVSTFELDRYYFADLPFGSQYGFTLGLAQVLLILAIVRGMSSMRQVWSVHLISAVSALTWWLNSLIPVAALALSYVLRTSSETRRRLWGLALTSTMVALGAAAWLAIAELNTGGIRPGTGVLGDGLRRLVNVPGGWLDLIRSFGPINIVQTHLEFFLRFVVPPFPFFLPQFSVGQQLNALGLLPRYGFTLDQPVTLPLAVSLSGVLAVFTCRGIRAWLAEVSDSERLVLARFGLLLFILPGLVFVTLLSSWAYGHHPSGRMAITPVGLVLAVGAYHQARRLIPKHGSLLLAGWLTVFSAFGISMTYSMTKTFDDSYNRAELAALDWFREHAAPGSVLLNNIPAFDNLYSTFDLFYADARAYQWSGWTWRLAFPVGFVDPPRPDAVSAYLDGLAATLQRLEGSVRSGTVGRARARIQELTKAVGKSAARPQTERERQELLDLYGQVFSDVRSLNQELRVRGLSPVPLPLPVSWGRKDTYLLLRKDFGLPPLFRGMNYSVVFESEYSTAPGAFLGARTAYNLICHEEVQGRGVPIRCRQAARKAMAASLRGDWQAIRSLSFITAQPSQDNFEFPIRGEAGSVGKILLVKLEGE